ncbi:MAG: amidase, partial [Flavobacteriales bacterium]
MLLFMACHTPEHTVKPLSIADEVTITDIRQALQNKDYTIVELTKYYLDRIDSLSFNGPTLNAVIIVNPDALAIAAQLDAELNNGALRGPLHGIPILLKDNIDTGDKMPCTAGARAMKDAYPTGDSPLAAQLRKAGAVILGKANMSEWANFHSNESSSGWSGLGGQTKNPYDLTRNPCGSSSGSGVAVSANLSVLAIGTETNGSIVCPSNNNGIVGIKPTVGLISRTGIIPISFTQDTPGPMARTVTDAAICLGLLTETDPKDPATLVPGRVSHSDYTPFLKQDGLRGKRIGYYKKPLGDNVRLTQVMDENVAFLKEQGATIIELEEILRSGVRDYSFQVLLYEFKDGLNKYFEGLGPKAPVSSLEDLIQKTFADSVEMHYHDHELLKLAQSKGDLQSAEYREALAASIKGSREQGIDSVMDAHQLDAIMAPTGGPAWKTDLTNGDNFGVSSSSPAAIAGYPNITVPMGEIDGLPVGVSFFGRAWTEPLL